eukprot:scaffold116332_cov23-Cyclotella_meneghiniana.AAC.1
MNQPPPPIPRPPEDPDADPVAYQRYLDAIANWEQLVLDGRPGTSAAYIDCLPSPFKNPSPFKKMNNTELLSAIDGRDENEIDAEDNADADEDANAKKAADENADAKKDEEYDDDDPEYVDAPADNFGDDKVAVAKKKRGTSFRSDEYVILGIHLGTHLWQYHRNPQRVEHHHEPAGPVSCN